VCVFGVFAWQVYFYYYHISNLLVTANSSVNFVVYCVFRRQFRRRLYACCCPSQLDKGRSSSIATEFYPLHTSTVVATSGNAPVTPDALWAEVLVEVVGSADLRTTIRRRWFIIRWQTHTESASPRSTTNIIRRDVVAFLRLLRPDTSLKTYLFTYSFAD